MTEAADHTADAFAFFAVFLIKSQSLAHAVQYFVFMESLPEMQGTP